MTVVVETDETETETCYACEHGGEVEHDCGLVNEECPSQCNTEHETDAYYLDYELECPQTGDHWEHCYDCGWVEIGRWGAEGRTGPDGNHYCERCSESIYSCESCGCAMWEDNARFSERHDTYYCEDCYEENASGFHGGSPERARRCSACNTYDRHMHMVTEEFLCDCQARQHDSGIVLLHHPLPAVIEATATEAAA